MTNHSELDKIPARDRPEIDVETDETKRQIDEVVRILENWDRRFETGEDIARQIIEV